MKLVLKSSSLVFAKAIHNQEVDIQPTTGSMYYWSPSARETIDWTSLTTNAKYQRSQVVTIDRTRYNKFKIEAPVDTYVWFAFAGAEHGQILHQSSTITTNTVFDLRTDTLLVGGVSRTFDAQIANLYEGEKVCQIAFSVKNDGAAPSMTAEQFAQIKIVLIP